MTIFQVNVGIESSKNGAVGPLSTVFSIAKFANDVQILCAGIKNDTYVVVDDVLTNRVEEYLSENKVLHSTLSALPERTDWNYKYTGEKLTTVTQ